MDETYRFIIILPLVNLCMTVVYWTGEDTVLAVDDDKDFSHEIFENFSYKY